MANVHREAADLPGDLYASLGYARGVLEPRRWQREAMKEWLPRRNGVISVVTGAGKTAFALMAFAEARKEVHDLRLVVVVPTIALLDQWVVALDTDAGVNGAEVATFSGEGRSSTLGLANVAVINTAREIADLFGDEAPTMLVVDECHRAGSPENARALLIPARMTLGLSATPVREFDDGFDRYIAPALGPVIYEYDYASARRDGVIAPFILHNYRFPLSSREEAEYEKLSGRIARRLHASGDSFDDPAVKRLLIARARIVVDSPRRTAAAVAVSDLFDGAKLIFHERIARAETIASLLDERGARVSIYHSKLPPALRRRNLELFKLGQVDTLVTCRALDEGLNVPNASTAVIAASTRSTRQRIQRLGRVLRQTPEKDSAAVATIYATELERTSLVHEASNLADVADTRWYEISL